MKTLLLNLPNQNRVTRRYMCSYLAANSLFPPLELIALGGIVENWKNDEVQLLDCIAQNYNLSQTIDFVKKFSPDIIVSISGFECFEEDMLYWNDLKYHFPTALYILFGHYATEFPEETLKNTATDYVILGEPDLIFSQLYDAIKFKDQYIKDIKGIAYIDNGSVIVQASNSRIPDPNKLPPPAYHLLPKNSYFEPFMPKPFGMIQSARGCPYQCNYCVKSFGTKLTLLSPENTIRDIKLNISYFNIKSLRFIDDTFTAIPRRVIEICRLILEEEIKISWTCLSRPETLNEEMIVWMAKAGCKRIYLGLESGSPKMLQLLNKNFDLDVARINIGLCKKHGIEVASFFLSGHPEETLEDVKMSADFAVKSGLDYVILNELTPYPGTALYNSLKSDIDFSIFPYKNNLLKKPFKFSEAESIFYKTFYLRINYIFRQFLKLNKYYSEIFMNILSLLKYMWQNKKLAFPNFKTGFNKGDISYNPVPLEKEKA